MKALKNCHVLVTPTSYGQNDKALKTQLEAMVGQVTYNLTNKPLSSEALQALLPDVDGFIAGLDVIDSAALEKANNLQVIARYGVGVSNVDLDVAKAKNIVVTNTPGANAKSVAELTIALIISLFRPIMTASIHLRQGDWMRTNGLSLDGKYIGIIGLGAIGQEVARRLLQFDCKVLAFDPATDEGFLAKYEVEMCDMNELLATSDLISLHLPVLSSTREMVNDDFIKKMKDGAFLVNTARGELIDEEALVRALNEGKLRGAALDTFRDEPPSADNPLLSLPQVIPTPHMGAHTDGATNSMGWMALNNCLAVMKGEHPLHRVV